MSFELERVYTINLGKVKLSQSQHRSVRAINMIKEFARHHMKTEKIKIEEELSHLIWSKGVRNPPRKVKVRMTKTSDGSILVSQYSEEVDSDAISEKEIIKTEDKAKEPTIETKVEDKEETTVETKTEPTIETKVEDKEETTVETKTEPTIETKVEDKEETTVETKTEPTIETKVEDKVKEASENESK